MREGWLSTDAGSAPDADVPRNLEGPTGFEPATSVAQPQRSTAELQPPKFRDHFSHIRVSNIFCISLVCICKLCQEGKSHIVIFAYIEGRGRGFDARGLRRPASGSIIPSFSEITGTLGMTIAWQRSRHWVLFPHFLTQFTNFDFLTQITASN